MVVSFVEMGEIRGRRIWRCDRSFVSVTLSSRCLLDFLEGYGVGIECLSLERFRLSYEIRRGYRWVVGFGVDGSVVFKFFFFVRGFILTFFVR